MFVYLSIYYSMKFSDLTLITHHNMLSNHWPLQDAALILNLPFQTHVNVWSISYEIIPKWMPQDITDSKSILAQVMATSHHLSQCWPTSLSLYGIIRQHWIWYTLFNCIFQYVFYVLICFIFVYIDDIISIWFSLLCMSISHCLYNH